MSRPEYIVKEDVVRGGIQYRKGDIVEWTGPTANDGKILVRRKGMAISSFVEKKYLEPRQ